MKDSFNENAEDIIYEQHEQQQTYHRSLIDRWGTPLFNDVKDYGTPF